MKRKKIGKELTVRELIKKLLEMPMSLPVDFPFMEEESIVGSYSLVEDVSVHASGEFVQVLITD